LATALLLLTFAASAAPRASNGQDLLDQVVAAYGGIATLSRIQSFEYEAAGYFIGRYQSRFT